MTDPSFTYQLHLDASQVEILDDVSDLILGPGNVETNLGEFLASTRSSTEKTLGQLTVLRGANRSTEFTKWIEEVANLETIQDVTITVTPVAGGASRLLRLHNAWASSWTDDDDDDDPEEISIDFENITVE